MTWHGLEPPVFVTDNDSITGIDIRGPTRAMFGVYDKSWHAKRNTRLAYSCQRSTFSQVHLEAGDGWQQILFGVFRGKALPAIQNHSSTLEILWIPLQTRPGRPS